MTSVLGGALIAALGRQLLSNGLVKDFVFLGASVLIADMLVTAWRRLTQVIGLQRWLYRSLTAAATRPRMTVKVADCHSALMEGIEEISSGLLDVDVHKGPPSTMPSVSTKVFDAG